MPPDFAHVLQAVSIDMVIRHSRVGFWQAPFVFGQPQCSSNFMAREWVLFSAEGVGGKRQARVASFFGATCVCVWQMYVAWCGVSAVRYCQLLQI